MSTAKWDAIAEAFDAGTFVPANGWEAWDEQAVQEAITIRSVLPASVDCLLEVGCGLGRLTPHLALLFPRIIAIDTSPVCRVVTRDRCRNNRNVKVMPADSTYGPADAALAWCLYDADWTQPQIDAHREALTRAYPLVLEGNAESHWLYERP